jgi:hypothetical protein
MPTEEPNISARQMLMEAIRSGGQDNPFWPARALAIQSYALLEQQLGEFFAGLSDTDPIVAGIIFFKITNTGARNAILEKLFKYKYKGSYNLFRNSLLKQLPAIDTKRNEIVHWNTIHRLSSTDEGELSGDLLLEPPSLWPEEPSEAALTINDLEAFRDKCRFYAQIIGRFAELVIHRRTIFGWPQERYEAWHDVFDQAIVYPPPADHPSLRWP